MDSIQESDLEQQRIGDLMRLVRLIWSGGRSALDVGARDGRFSSLLVERFEQVTALDLDVPDIRTPGIVCVRGDVTDLHFDEDSFDLVVCTEVLEHIPARGLAKAGMELSRVTRDYLLVGVPYLQDIRVGRTTCHVCGAHNPPWGHVNSFDETALLALFPGMAVEQRSWVGRNGERTNFVSTFLMDLAGNAYGTYGQQETCVQCGAPVTMPTRRTMTQKALTRLAFWARRPSELFHKTRPNWIHLLLRKPRGQVASTEASAPAAH